MYLLEPIQLDQELLVSDSLGTSRTSVVPDVVDNDWPCSPHQNWK